MDTIDLYQPHRWDRKTPIETTLRALDDDAVRRGHVRYIGASSMWAHQFADSLHTSDRLGPRALRHDAKPLQPRLPRRGREMLPLCDKEDVGVMPWSPLARGYLTRPHEEIDATTRGETEEYLYEHPYREGGGQEINERVADLADDKGATMAQIALSWLLHKDWVDAPIVGTTSVEHLEQAVEALEISLSESDLEYLEEPYEPVPVSGHR